MITLKLISTTPLKTEAAIRQAVDSGCTVFWRSENSHVIKTKNNGYRVKTRVNDHKYLLTHLDKLVDFSGTNDFYYLKEGA